MKVYDLNLTGAAELGPSQEVQRTPQQNGQTARASSSAADDHVELSNTLSSLARAMSSYSDTRTAKVQALAAQYQSGSYKVDSQATSRAMITDALAGGGE